MKKGILLLLGFYTPLYSFAQRLRARPEDYENSPDYSSSSSDLPAAFWLILLAIMLIGIIWFKIALSNSRNKEIRNKTILLTNQNITAYISPYRATTETTQAVNKYIPKEFFIDDNGVISIPKYSKCIILEYYKENHSFVKVKFDNYPEPLYIGRWYLRTPDELAKEEGN